MEKYIYLLQNNNKKSIIIFFCLNIFLIVFETFGIALIPAFVAYIVDPGVISKITYEPLVEYIQSKDHITIIYIGVGLFIFLFFFKNLYLFFVMYYQAILQKKFNYDLKKKFFSLYINSPFSIIKQYNSSEILRNVDNETSDYVTNFFLIIKFGKDMLQFFCIFLLLLYVDFLSTFFVVIFLVLSVIIYFLFFYKRLRILGQNRVDAISSIYKWINQSVGAIKEVKINRKERNILETFLSKVYVFENSRKTISVIQAIPAALFETIFVSITLLLVAFIVTNEKINILPLVSLYIFAFIRILPIFSRFGSYISNLRASYPSVILLNNELKKLEEYNIEKEKIDKLSKNKKLEFNNQIEFKDIYFDYKNEKKEIFKGLNYKIKKNTCIAFVGKSGAGKTTLINILAGLLKPNSGQIKIDNIILDNDINLWQKKIGLISQENYLLDDTIKNNIIFLNSDEEINNENLNDAILFSGLKNFIDALPNKLETIVGEKGSFLSGGQVQRIALARLLYRNPEVLILDEFTNSLDFETENFILEKLNELKTSKNKTIIMISHKMKPLKICDEIVILNNGNIEKVFNYKEFHDQYNLLYD